jgi:hypothetical protein
MGGSGSRTSIPISFGSVARAWRIDGPGSWSSVGTRPPSVKGYYMLLESKDLGRRMDEVSRAERLTQFSWDGCARLSSLSFLFKCIGATMFTSSALAWDGSAPAQSRLILTSEEVGLDTEEGGMYLRAVNSEHGLAPCAPRKQRSSRHRRMST